jgi:two-component system KDP operon response regulator KdpE
MLQSMTRDPSPATAPVTQILIVEDEPRMRKLLQTALSARSFRVFDADSLKAALIAATTCNPEVILLDLGLPDGDGIDFARQVREWSHVPIIVVSARGREDDKVAALDAGADDYLTKPFGINELLARIRVALRRSTQLDMEPGSPVLELGPLSIDPVRREVTVDGREIHLTPIEYRLLVFMARNAGKVLLHSQILKEVWGPAHAEQTQYLRVFMAQLRRKIELNPARPKLLLTEPGVGYRIRDT